MAEVAKSPLDPTVVPLMTLGGGLNVLKPSTHIEDSQATEIENFDVFGGLLRTRRTMAQLASATFPDRVTGVGVARFEDGTTVVCVHTPTKFYVWNGMDLIDRTPTGDSAFTASTEGERWATASALDRYFFGNLADGVYVWDGSSNPATKLTLAAGYVGPSVLKAKFLCSAAGRVFIAHTDEGGLHETRVRWCGSGTPLNWDTSDTVGAGAVDLADTPGRVTGITKTNDSIVVTKEDGIVLGRESGDSNFPIVFPTWLQLGCPCGSSIQGIDPNTLVFLGYDNVYELRFGATKPIANAVVPKMLTDVNYSALENVLSWTEPERSLYCLAIPTGSQQFPTTVYAYNWLEDVWSTRSYPYELTSVSPRVSVSTGISWRDVHLAVPWNSATLAGKRWIDYYTAAAAPRSYFGSGVAPADHRVYVPLYSAPEGDANGPATRFEMTWASKDFRPNPTGYCSLAGFYLVYSATHATTVVAETSVDEGTTWRTAASSTLPPGTGRRVRLPIKATGLTCRIRLTLTPNLPAESPGNYACELHSADLMFSARWTLRP